jgi:hypothetical protein
MSDTATPAGRLTRRQFVKTVAGTAAGAIAAPAIVRGRNLNDKPNLLQRLPQPIVVRCQRASV